MAKRTPELLARNDCDICGGIGTIKTPEAVAAAWAKRHKILPPKDAAGASETDTLDCPTCMGKGYHTVSVPMDMIVKEAAKSFPLDEIATKAAKCMSTVMIAKALTKAFPMRTLVRDVAEELGKIVGSGPTCTHPMYVEFRELIRRCVKDDALTESYFGGKR